MRRKRPAVGSLVCNPRHRGFSNTRDSVVAGGQQMCNVMTTMRRCSASDRAPAWARYSPIEAGRIGVTALVRGDRIPRVMIVRHEIPPAFVEWVER